MYEEYESQYERDVIGYLGAIKEEQEDFKSQFIYNRQDIWDIKTNINQVRSALVSGDSYLNSELYQIKQTNTGIIIVIVLFIIYYFIMRCLK